MEKQEKVLTSSEVESLFNLEEDHFTDFKDKRLSGKGFGKILSAFANAAGGDIYIGIREDNITKKKTWEGFQYIEEANSLLQIIDEIPSLENYCDIEFLKHPDFRTYILKVNVFKTRSIIRSTDGKIFVRKGAQSLPVDTEEKRRRLELDKGISSYENEPVGESEITDATQSRVFKQFSSQIIPKANPIDWLKKQ